MLRLLLEIGLVIVLHKESKPRGRGVSQMSALLYTNPYIVKWSTKGEGKGGEKVQKTVDALYEQPQTLLPNLIN